MLVPSSEATDTLDSLESLQARTLADAFRWAWLIWLFWAVGVYYWLGMIPLAVGATIVVLRRLPGRAGVVPARGWRLVAGTIVVAVIAFAIAPISPLGWALAVSVGIVALGWIWPGRLAIEIGGGLAAAAVVLVLLLPEREATVAIACVYAATFVAYAFFERARLNSLR